MSYIESNVRSYCRDFPNIFSKARGAKIFDVDNNEYIDFLSGSGSLNYGHNNTYLKIALLEYINEDGIALSLDLKTDSKSSFLEKFQTHILSPRNLNYRVQFTGPTGTNAIEAAIKLARKVTKRSSIISFTNGFHGCTLGSLSITGNGNYRSGSASILGGAFRAPYDGYFGSDIDTSDMLEKLLEDPSSGFDAPAAIILECVQGEGGLNAASRDWLVRIQEIARKHGALLIVDDIQAGCGRTGTFFSFEGFDIEPDIVVLAKSISGLGLPMSLVLMKPELDVWEPGEHTGTFRGNNHAFVTAAEALRIFWSDSGFSDELARKIALIDELLSKIAVRTGSSLRGRGMMRGIDLEDQALSAVVKGLCFENRLIIEVAGPHSEILKVFPPLTASEEELRSGLSIIEKCIVQASSQNLDRIAV